MLKLIIVLLILIALYVLWRLFAKHKINAAVEQQRQDLSKWIKNPPEDHELPEKTKLIKQMIDQERQKNTTEISPTQDPIDPVSYTHLDVYKRQVVMC